MIPQSHFVNELVENHTLRTSFCFRSYAMEASVATLHKIVVEKIVLLANFAPPFPCASNNIVECFQKCRIFVVFCLECLEAYYFDFLFSAS
jgi:hypothetical protein